MNEWRVSDGNVHLHGAGGPQHTGEHGYTLFGEGVGEVFPHSSAAQVLVLGS